MKFWPLTRSNKYLGVFVVAMMVTIAAGWLLTGFLGRVAEKEFKLDSGLRASRTASFLQDNLEVVTNAAKSLGPADAIVAALASGSSADLEKANRLLDRIKDNFEMTICYLIDRNGLTVASTDRHEKNSFVGQSFVSRPYFTGAMKGHLTTYFALGKVSRERGYYAAVPVIGNRGTITGVLVIKRNVAPVEEFFKKDPHAYLVSPEGIIFISSRKEDLYRSLWPVTEKQRQELLASGQFGSLTFAPLLETEPRSGTYVRFLNENHYVQRLPFGSEGWTLVMIEHPHVVASYRLFGMILTAVFTLLLLLFFFVLQYKNKSLETARELLKARDDWKRTFDTVPDLIATIDSNHRIINMNRAMAERLGISQNEAVGRRCCELVHGSQEPPPSCPHRRSFLSGRAEAETLFELNLNGDFIVTVSPLLAEDGSVESSVHVMHDVTEMKRLGEEVNRNNNLAAIGLLAGGLAHDFNNLLTVIYGNISFAKMLARNNAAIVEPLADAEVGCERARDLGISLQVFSQGSSPDRVPLALVALIEDAAREQFEGTNITYTIVAAEGLLPVEVEPQQIRQLFQNLLLNAKEAMSAGGTVQVNMDNYLVADQRGLPLRPGSYVCITIKDAGTGIPEQNLPKILDPYFSTKDTFSQKGLGLGLFICHTILKQHDGHLAVASTVGIGTTVTIFLPATVNELIPA